MMSRNMIVVLLTALLLGLGVGYFLNISPPPQPDIQPAWSLKRSYFKTLSLDRMWSLQPPTSGRVDPSGLTYWPPTNSLLTVDDKPHVVKLFALSLQDKKKAEVKTLTLFHQNSVQVKRPMSDVWRWYRLGLDLEAITVCGKHIWLAAEQTRTLLRLNPATGHVTQHTLNLEKYGKTSALDRHPMPGMSRDHNASFEGLACDAKHRRLYVIQERQPRLILQVRLPESFRNHQVLPVVDHFDLPTFSLPRRFGRLDSEPDFSGADMDGKYLYVLYRNARLVLKVDPIRHKLLDVRSYLPAVKDLYRLSKPFGLAEGLVVKGDRIWIVMDNNGKPRWQRKNDRRAVLLSFHRPKGF